MKGLSEGGPGWGLDWKEIQRPQGRKISWEAAAEVQAQAEGIGRVHGGAGGRSGACSNSASLR